MRTLWARSIGSNTTPAIQPQPKIRPKQGLIKGHLDLIWALCWVGAVWLRVVLGSMIHDGAPC